ncbi:SDR family NAD(P)-dependent oxidoreductase [Streptomyces reniochalinae]|uniref:SDR family NAD(P)-dependent oxidoreductase n=1 Tax=Streptomyces reniochalinae TaxID=2250578 RepID=A0A367EEC4_9ACTN|nr:SDR family oxidoreductase [Streptomyces reniochalinae]RCG15995.1 SDR family NAD(P)-dependent oxidoreductase [Streptomyces reniochalinae]
MDTETAHEPTPHEPTTKRLETTVTAHPTSGPLAGKAALVTGGSRGIGAAVAMRLAADGADVALTYQSNGELARRVAERVKQSGARAWTVRADLADAAAVRAAVDGAVGTFGRLDILVNNAGTGAAGALETVEEAELDRVLAANVRGAYLVAQAAASHMADGGRIVNVGSCVADHVPFPGMTLYAMSKAAVSGLTKGLARELAARGITVNQVAPGPVDTDMNPADGDGGAAQAALTLLGRYGTPEEIADSVAHLVGDAGRWITGASLAVDGGFAA